MAIMPLQLSWPKALAPHVARFNRLSVRERSLIGIGVLACLLTLWDSLLMQPLNARQASLLAILDGAGAASTNVAADSVATADSPQAGDEIVAQPISINELLSRREALRGQLKQINAQLKSASAELIAPEHTSEVLYDVLRQQHSLALISLQNQAVRSLVTPPVMDATNTDTKTAAPASGPFLHPVELVVEGRYLDILGYLRALEALPWSFDWMSLQLDGRQPINRARIQLSTLSLDPAWIGT